MSEKHGGKREGAGRKPKDTKQICLKVPTEIVNNIGNKITSWEVELFLTAVNTKGTEATGYVWLQWWFDNRNIIEINKENEKRIIEASEKNSLRIWKKLKSK
ncbi:hypothetical protein [Tenacibaculum maritimum]|uniref:hypothetical protein n=1 Tax=Tenacibaculum maritimum TaxID=107401 RepID=UPI003875B2CD